MAGIDGRIGSERLVDKSQLPAANALQPKRPGTMRLGSRLDEAKE